MAKMIPVIASTKIDKSKIDLAGVDSGAKIFVRPVDEVGVSATAVATQQNTNTRILSAFCVIEFVVRRILRQILLLWTALACTMPRPPAEHITRLEEFSMTLLGYLCPGHVRIRFESVTA